jgi:hypothetical protein
MIKDQVPQLSAHANDPPRDRLPADAQRMRTWSYAQVKMHISNDNPFEAEELAILRPEGTRTVHLLGDLPLIVLSRGLPEDSSPAGQTGETEHTRDQAALVALSRIGKQVVAKRSGHHIPLDKSDLVVAAIRDVIAAARRRGRSALVPRRVCATSRNAEADERAVERGGRAAALSARSRIALA